MLPPAPALPPKNPFINYGADECSEKSSDYEEEAAFNVTLRQKNLLYLTT